ncbi:MAG: MvdC/MvdD family ATP grasp protein [Bacteroidota bacterium]
MSKVLIITYTEDNECIERVTEKLEAKGSEVIRFDTDMYPGETTLTSSFTQGKWQHALHQRGVTHDLSDLTAIWYRRQRLGEGLAKRIEQKYWSSARQEADYSFQGFMLSQTSFILDPVWRVKAAGSKQLQLQLAHQLGLNIPETLISNDPQQMRGFYQAQTTESREVITKMQASFAIMEQGKETVVFTNVLQPEHLEDSESLTLCPMQFQTKEEKAVELRVTVVGTQIFAWEIDSQSSEAAKHDWRRDGANMLDQWKPHALPQPVADALLKLMDALMLNYGAADFIVTPEGKYVFLEVNPSGEFFWLDRLEEDHAISEALARVLVGEVPRRHQPYPSPTA